MKVQLKRLFRRMFYLIPKNQFLYRTCKRYVDDFNGEHNCDTFTNGEYQFLQEHVSKTPGAIIFDVGANKGEWARLALQINPSAIIHCFEPVSSSYSKLLQNNFSSNVICNNFGLDYEAKTVNINIFGDGSEVNSLYFRHDVTIKSTEQIRLENLLDYCSYNSIDHIDYLKIDVEGNEYNVIKGAAEMLQNEQIKIIQFEYGEAYIGARHLLLDIFNLVRNFNYTLYKIMPNGVRKITDYDRLLENFQNANYALILNK